MQLQIYNITNHSYNVYLHMNHDQFNDKVIK
jgi:hypothetical protein